MRTAIYGILVTIATAMLSAVGGGLIGWLIGAIAPSYYRAMFRHVADDPNFSAAAFGLAAGLAQGATMGFIVGGVIVAVTILVRGRQPR